MTKTQPLKLTIKSSIFDRNRRLTIDADFIEFDDNSSISKSPTRFVKSDIDSFKVGIKWIDGYKFIIGRIFYIDIKDKNNRIIKIRLKSIYGIRKKLLADKYALIVQTLYDNFFDDIARQYLTKFDNKIDFVLGGLLFSQKGISFDKNEKCIPWEDIGTSSYWTYYTIYPKSDASAYKAFDYLYDWNARTVYSVSRQILIFKGLHNE